MATHQEGRLGRYEILSVLGRGAMGTVYKARDPMLDRMVAVKTITIPGGAPQDTQGYRERFFREARAAGRLSHPGIITIFDVDVDAERGPYIVMEYVAGQTLDQFCSAGNEKRSLPRTLDLVQQLALALQCAHSQGIIHRDLKPANILVTPDGRAKIADFGVAKLDLSQFTSTGVVFGTPSFMSPEQLEGAEVDARSDLFSLGVILYSLLTGYRPFQGTSVATISFKVVYHDPVPVTALNATLPPGTQHVVSRALAKVPTDRYQSAEEMALDLQDLQEGLAPRSQPFSPGSTGSHAPRSWRLTPASQLHPIRDMLHWMRSSRGRQVSLVLLVLSALFAAWTVHHARALESISAPLSEPDASPRSALDVPATAKPTAVKPAASVAPAPDLCFVGVTVHHPFADATLTVWVDNKLAYRHELHGEPHKHMLLLKNVQGDFSGNFNAPVGEHVLRVQLTAPADGFQRTETLRAAFRKNQPTTLAVEVHGRARELALAIAPPHL
jgi:serine/threonine protein kinase